MRIAVRSHDRRDTALILDRVREGAGEADGKGACVGLELLGALGSGRAVADGNLKREATAAAVLLAPDDPGEDVLRVERLENDIEALVHAIERLSCRRHGVRRTARERSLRRSGRRPMVGLEVGRGQTVEALSPARIDAASCALDPLPVGVEGSQGRGLVVAALGIEPREDIGVEMKRDFEGGVVSPEGDAAPDRIKDAAGIGKQIGRAHV